MGDGEHRRLRSFVTATPKARSVLVLDPAEFDFRSLLPVELSGSSAQWDSLVEAVEQLPEQDREVIEALFWERASMHTTAARLGISTRGVQTRRDRALRALREAIEDV